MRYTYSVKVFSTFFACILGHIALGCFKTLCLEAGLVCWWLAAVEFVRNEDDTTVVTGDRPVTGRA